MAVQRTAEQEQVVQNRGGGLLVSAAAGSGKTRVLVERLLERVVREGKNIDEFLIITFTRAAAEELRGRIARELAQLQAEHPEDSHLRRQSALLYQTQISTIHAFCTVLLRQWGHLLDVPADFALCEDEETDVLLHRTLDQVLEQRYETVDETFAGLLDVLSAGRDDSRLIDIVLDVYGKIQSDPDPETWLKDQRKELALEGITDAGETKWGRCLLEDAARTAEYWAGQLRRGCELAREDETLDRAYSPSLAVTLADFERFAQAAREGWDAASRCIIDYPKLGGARGVENKDLQEQIKSIRDRSKKAAEKLQTQFESDSAQVLADMALMRPAMDGLLSLVLDFSDAYEQEKKKRSLLDFSDLEHLTIRLLTDEEGQPTDLARQWGGQYAEIMVDEYQDTNQVQNIIFRALSDEGKNLFMVGDVKQSIYRFRLADPTIFLEKYRAFAPWDRAEEGQERKITLSKNFRSRPEVLEAANDIFKNIMSRELGELDYTADEALYPEGTFPEGTGYETELHVLDFSEDPALTEDKADRHLLEARFVARRIAALLEAGFPVADGPDKTRPIRPEDIAILLRSPGPVRGAYTRALEEEGVNWTAEEGNDFFSSTEISIALSWLQIIDNPRQDIPLLAVLRSPVCGFTGDRLAQLRSAQREGDYYTALKAGAERGEEDCAAFLEDLSALRFGAGEKSSHKLLWDLYARTDLPAIVSAMPGGEKRRENLLQFYELARRYEGAGHKGLFSFLLHLEHVQESGGIRTAASPAKEGGGVKLLSIHRSKGLEYPVVFLCGLGRRFNLSDLQKPVLFHPKLGLGPKGLDSERMVEFTTVARTGVAQQLTKELMAEEMRLLYVAMTRAKEKLILTHSLSFPSDLKNLAEGVDLPVDPRVLADQNSVGKWVLLTAMARPEGAALRKAAGREDLPLPNVPLGPAWRIEYHTGAVSQEVHRVTVRTEDREEAAPMDRERILRELAWRYPYQTAAATPAKVTATQVRFAQEEEPGLFLLRDREEEGESPFRRPVFAQESLGLTAAQKGTALHTVMQCIDLNKTSAVEDIRQELARLTARQHLTEQQAKSVDPAAVARFFASDVGQAIRASDTLRREYPFSLLAPAQRFFPQAPEGEEILLQGVIDCWFETGDGITIVDFKTDRVAPADAPARAQEYQGQLAAYAWALETLTGKKVKHRILWFLRPQIGIDLAEE